MPNRKLVWTDTLEAEFRPTSQAHLSFRFTATLTLEPHGKGTKYTAHVMHADEADRNKHDAMGFAVGWNAALDQLIAHVKSVRG